MHYLLYQAAGFAESELVVDPLVVVKGAHANEQKVASLK